MKSSECIELNLQVQMVFLWQINSNNQAEGCDGPIVSHWTGFIYRWVSRTAVNAASVFSQSPFCFLIAWISTKCDVGPIVPPRNKKINNIIFWMLSLGLIKMINMQRRHRRSNKMWAFCMAALKFSSQNCCLREPAVQLETRTCTQDFMSFSSSFFLDFLSHKETRRNTSYNFTGPNFKSAKLYLEAQKTWRFLSPASPDCLLLQGVEFCRERERKKGLCCNSQRGTNHSEQIFG